MDYTQDYYCSYKLMDVHNLACIFTLLVLNQIMIALIFALEYRIKRVERQRNFKLKEQIQETCDKEIKKIKSLLNESNKESTVKEKSIKKTSLQSSSQILIFSK